MYLLPLILYLTIVQLLSEHVLPLIAAVLWFWSATVSIPASGQFPITVVRPDAVMGPLGQPLGGTYVGNGYSPELQAWASEVSSAFALQSRLNGLAAISAGISATSAAAAVFAGIASST